MNIDAKKTFANFTMKFTIRKNKNRVPMVRLKRTSRLTRINRGDSPAGIRAKQSFVLRILDLCLQYIRETCRSGSLHGISHFVAPNRHYFETIFWMIAVIYSCFAFFMITSNIYDHYITSPTVISMERNPLAWNVTFPATTFCPRDVNSTALDEIVSEFNVTDTEELKEFLTMLVKLSIVGMTDEDIVDHDAVQPERYLELVNRLLISFTPTLLTSATVPIIPQKTMTEVGICYAINSNVAIYNSPNYWLENRWDQVSPVLFQVHPSDGEQIMKISDFNNSYDLYYHGPDEIPKLLDKNYGAERLTLNAVAFHALDIQSTEEVRSLSPKQRKCRYTEEFILTRTPIYTYNMCVVECRARKILELCGCLPHFYRRLNNERICPASEMRCLYVYKSVLQETARQADCKCLPTCDSTFFTVHEDFVMFWNRWTEIKFGIKEFPKYRLKREVLFGITDVLVNCGGAAGLLLGCSVLSVMEIFYFSTLRLFWFFYEHFKDTKRTFEK